MIQPGLHSRTVVWSVQFDQQRIFPYGRNSSIRAASGTPVADYPPPVVSSMLRFPYRPLIAVYLFLLVLSVYILKRSLWRCGQLGSYIGVGSLGTRLHRDCNALSDTTRISPRVVPIFTKNANLSLQIIQDCKEMSDAAKISPPVSSTCTQNAILCILIIHIIPSRQI
jgi:hypothetical protein